MKQVKLISPGRTPLRWQDMALAYLSQKLADQGRRVADHPRSGYEGNRGRLSDIARLRRTSSRYLSQYCDHHHGSGVFPLYRYQRLAETLPEENVVSIFDRGIRDSWGYLELNEFDAIYLTAGGTNWSNG